MLGSWALALAPYGSFRTLARPDLQFPNVSSYVAALVAVPSECVPPGSVPALVHKRHTIRHAARSACAVPFAASPWHRGAQATSQ